MRGKYVIAGVGQTKFGSLPGRSTISLNVEAVRHALADAGVEKGTVDSLFVKYPTSGFESIYGHKLAEALGVQPRIGGVLDQAGAANVRAVAAALINAALRVNIGSILHLKRF